MINYVELEEVRERALRNGETAERRIAPEEGYRIGPPVATRLGYCPSCYRDVEKLRTQGHGRGCYFG